MLSGDLWLLWAALLLVTEQGKCSSFLPHHCPHQLCDGEAWKGIPICRKEAEAEFPSAQDPLAHTGLRAVPAARVCSPGVFHLHMEMTNYSNPVVSPRQLQSHLPGAVRDV